MPIPLLAAAAPKLIGAIGGSLLGKFFGGSSGEQKAANRGMSDIATGAGREGLGLLTEGRQSLATPASYFQSILSGNMGEPTSALAPEVNRIRDATQQALQAKTNLAPRSGARSSALFAIPSTSESAIQDVYNRARPMAASGLAEVGSRQGGLGTSASGVAANAWEGLQQQLADQKSVQRSAGETFGSAIYDILKGSGVDWGAIIKGWSGKGTPLSGKGIAGEDPAMYGRG